MLNMRRMDETRGQLACLGIAGAEALRERL